MKRIKNIIKVFSLVMVLTLPSACSKESFIDDDSNIAMPQGKVRLKLNTNNGEFQTPSTRAIANETDIDNAWVLVFKGSDYNATFVEAVKSEGTYPDQYIELTKATGAHKLLVIANADAFINAKKALLTAGTTTLTEAISTLQYGNPYNVTLSGDGTLANPQMAMPFAEPEKRIPMSEVLSVSSISPAIEINSTGTAGGGALELRRITAKVVVDGSAVFDKFKIYGVAAYQGARSSVSLVPGDNNAIQTGGTFINYHKGSASVPTEICANFAPGNVEENNTENYPVYVYESTGTSNFIIIKAMRNFDAKYYKLRLAKPDGTDYEIKRNHKYIFQIESVHDDVSIGYLTLQEAINGTESNIAGKIIEIKDSTPTDIIDNGAYYLGTDCSEVFIYSSILETSSSTGGIPLVIITTNATAEMVGGVNSITSSPFSISNDGTNKKVTLATGPNPATTVIKLSTLSASVSSGTITIKLGNLTKTINVIRKPLLGYGGFEAVGSSTDKFTAGVVDQTSTLFGFALSTDGMKASGKEQFAASTSSGTSVHLCADIGNLLTNRSGSALDTRTWGVAYLSRAGISSSSTPSRVKLLVRQDFLKVDPIKVKIGLYWPYVGAFWKHDEVGERLISMKNTTNTEWSVTVVDGADWIELDTNYPGLMPNDLHISQGEQIGSGLTTVSGSGVDIKFRIGLKSTYTPTPNAPVRYGLVLVNYADKSKAHPIFIRQGEDPDFLMRQGDLDGRRAPVADNRYYARKFSPYNLADFNYEWNYDVGFRGGSFTDYPTQGGALWQWANEGNTRYAYDSHSPVSGWNNSNTSAFWNILGYIHETCPDGYYRPTDGNTNGLYQSSIATSEMRQSLWLNPATAAMGNKDNSLFGYYADGFFDRFTIGPSISNVANSAVLPVLNMVAYVGNMFFNPNTHASLFFPAAGYRRDINGSISNTGDSGFYWTSTSGMSSKHASYLTFNYILVRNAYDKYKSSGYSIRCVKDDEY